MGVLFAKVDHETGDLSQYDSTVEDLGDLSVGAAGGLNGTANGLIVLIDDQTNIYGVKNINIASTSQVRAKFWVDPNTLTMASGNQFDVISVQGNDSDQLMSFRLRGSGAGTYATVHFLAFQDPPGPTKNIELVMSDAPHEIEIHVERASNSTAADGRAEVFIDGVSKHEHTSIDNWDRWTDIFQIKFGATLGIDAGTSGTFYLDELEAFDSLVEEMDSMMKKRPPGRRGVRMHRRYGSIM